MTFDELRQQTCVPCKKGEPPLSYEEAKERVATLTGWVLSPDGKSLSKVFVMRDFSAAIGFINAMFPIAEEQDHHPDLHLTSYRRLQIILATHSIGGLSQNDFILAAKIEGLPKQLQNQ